MRDPELDELLEPLRTGEPDEGDIQRWKKITYQKKRSWIFPITVAAALSVGFFSGKYFSNDNVTTEKGPQINDVSAVAKVDDANATIEHIFIKSSRR